METPHWFPDELAHAGSEHLDLEYIRGYDRKSAVDPLEDVELLRGLGLNDTHTLVDLGAGTGVIPLAVAPLCQRVVAVDVSSGMLAYLSEQAKRSGIANIECVQAGFLSYQHHGEPADFVYSRNALHHLPDFWKAIALKRIAALLKPGGVLRLHDLVFSFEPSEADQTIEAWLVRAAERPEEGWTRSELETHVREEYSTFSWLLEPMIKRAGFRIQEASHRPARVYSAYTCVKT